MRSSIFTIFAAVAVASTTMFSLSQSQVGVTASVILGLSISHHSLVAAFALPQNLRLDARHGNHNSGNDTDGTDPDDRERNRGDGGDGGNGNGNGRNGTRNDSDRGDRNRNDIAGATPGDGNDGDNSRKGRPGAGDAGSGGNNIDGVPSTGSQRKTNGTSTRTSDIPLTTGTGNAVGRNGTSSGSDGSTGGQAGKGTLPVGFPPAVPGPDFVAGERKRSVAGLPRSVAARTDHQISRKIGRTARMKVPVSPKRDVYRDTYDI